MTDILLTGILIMMIINFHYNCDGGGRYAKLFDFFIHRPTKYLERGACKCASKLRRIK